MTPRPGTSVVLSLLVILSLAPGTGVPAAAAQVSRPGDARTLADTGDRALGEKRYADALEAFSAAVQLAPGEASLRAGAGVAAFMLGDTKAAQQWLEGALKLRPDYTDASLVLGLAYYRAGDLQQAIDTYEQALRHAPGHKELTSQLERWTSEAALQNRFYQAQGAHFTVLFEGPADDALARAVVEMLEQAYFRLGSTFQTYPSDPITVVLYTKEQFRDVTRSPAWAGGAYDGRIKVPVLNAAGRMEELRRVVEHEYVHALVWNVGGASVPTWLNEGLATALEPGGQDWAAETLARSRRRLPAAQLADGFGRLGSDDARLAYAQSAAAVKHLMDLRGSYAVVTLLQALRRGLPFETAFQQAVFMRYEDFLQAQP